jgi:type IV pilus assembly protein PilN
MTTINLLPWRDTLREEQHREFLASLVSVAVFAGLVMLIIHALYAYQLREQNFRNQTLKAEVQQLDVQLVEVTRLLTLKAEMIRRMKIMRSLQAQRPQIVHLFDDMVTVLPKGIHFSKVVLKNNVVEMHGIAQSNTSISKLMRNINASPWINRPELSEIKTKHVANALVNEFQLRSVLSSPEGVS